jgi:tellurium resistance protein TerD
MKDLIQNLDLVKGDHLDLTKEDGQGYKRVAFAMGWKATKVIVDGKETDADPDASAFLLGDTGRLLTADISSIVFYKNSKSMGVEHTGDDRGGAANADDRETIIVDFEKVDPRVEQVLFLASLYDDGAARGKYPISQSKLNFGQVNDLYVRAYDMDTGQELLRFRLNEDASRYNIMQLCKIYRRNGIWRFNAMEEGKNGDINTLRAAYLV